MQHHSILLLILAIICTVGTVIAAFLWFTITVNIQFDSPYAPAAPVWIFLVPAAFAALFWAAWIFYW